jgi:hypothetical protein
MVFKNKGLKKILLDKKDYVKVLSSKLSQNEKKKR